MNEGAGEDKAGLCRYRGVGGSGPGGAGLRREASDNMAVSLEWGCLERIEAIGYAGVVVGCMELILDGQLRG